MAKRGQFQHRGGVYADAYIRHRAYVGGKDSGALISYFDVHPVAGDWLAYLAAKQAVADAAAGQYEKGPLLEQAEALVVQKTAQVMQALAAFEQASAELMALGSPPESPEERAQWFVAHEAKAAQEGELQQMHERLAAQLSICQRNLANIAEQRKTAAVAEAEAALDAGQRQAQPLIQIEVKQPWVENMRPEASGYAKLLEVHADLAAMDDA